MQLCRVEATRNCRQLQVVPCFIMENRHRNKLEAKKANFSEEVEKSVYSCSKAASINGVGHWKYFVLKYNLGLQQKVLSSGLEAVQE